MIPTRILIDCGTRTSELLRTFNFYLLFLALFYFFELFLLSWTLIKFFELLYYEVSGPLECQNIRKT